MKMLGIIWVLDRYWKKLEEESGMSLIIGVWYWMNGIWWIIFDFLYFCLFFNVNLFVFFFIFVYLFLMFIFIFCNFFVRVVYKCVYIYSVVKY